MKSVVHPFVGLFIFCIFSPLTNHTPFKLSEISLGKRPRFHYRLG